MCLALIPVVVLVSILLLMYWKNQSDDNILVATARGIIGAIDEEARARGTADSYKYMNYAFNFQDPIGSYGLGNSTMVQEVSRKYDVHGLFQKCITRGFKLFS